MHKHCVVNLSFPRVFVVTRRDVTCARCHPLNASICGCPEQRMPNFSANGRLTDMKNARGRIVSFLFSQLRIRIFVTWNWINKQSKWISIICITKLKMFNMMSCVFLFWYQIEYISIYTRICKSDYTRNRFLHLVLVYTPVETVDGSRISFWEGIIIMTYIFFLNYL